MKIYYIGKLIDNSNITETKVEITYYKYFDHNTADNKFYKLEPKKFNTLKAKIRSFLNNYEGINDAELIKILEESIEYMFKYTARMRETIIYEIIEDENGKFYGKELITGLLFPLIKKPTKILYTYEKAYQDLELLKKVYYEDENLAKLSCFIIPDSVANTNYINNYLKENNKKTFIDQITKYYNENVFKKEIIEKIQEPTLHQNELTKILEQIEYLLCLLKQHNNEQYSEYEKLYNDLFINHEEKYKAFNKPIYKNPSRSELLDLLSNVKLSLLLNEKKCKNIIEYFNILIEDYLTKFFNNNIEVTDINIHDLDNIMIMFLKDKNNDNLQQQRKALIKISLLYLLVTKHNIDNLTEEQLENSYFKDNLRTIVLNINTLYELGVVKEPVIVYGDDILTIPYILELIKNIEFNKIKNADIKKLVK